MCEKVPVRKAAIYRAIDLVRGRRDESDFKARDFALAAVVGDDDGEVEAARDAAVLWHHRSVAYRDAVQIIEQVLDEAVRSGEPLV